ncbi:MAG: hypothetical protein ACI90V_007308, partial [Bacillariaceae sp.]
QNHYTYKESHGGFSFRFRLLCFKKIKNLDKIPDEESKIVLLTYARGFARNNLCTTDGNHQTFKFSRSIEEIEESAPKT